MTKTFLLDEVTKVVYLKTETRPVLRLDLEVVWPDDNPFFDEDREALRVARYVGENPDHLGVYNYYPFRAAERCVREGFAEGIEYRGRSTVKSRNSIHLALPKVKVVAKKADIRDNNFHWVSPVIISCSDEQVEIEVGDPNSQLACQKIWQEERNADIVRETERLMAGRDVAKVSGFDLTLLGRALDTRTGECPAGYHVLMVHGSAHHTAALIVRLGSVIRVPKDLVGLVIGRGGQNIKDLSKKIGSRIEVKTI